jgi:RNA polymerase sigma-70 factor (ECF subfamily)
MAEPLESLSELLHKAAHGDEAAQSRFVERYGKHVLRIVRRGLVPRLRSIFDSADFVQDIWASFFAQCPGAEVWESPERIAAYLTAMAGNKMTEIFRQRFQSHRYNLRRELQFDEDVHERLCDRPTTDPTPSQHFMAEEQFQQLLQGLPDHYRRILELRRAGYTHEEIAQQLGIHKKTVSRVIQQVQVPFEAS